MVRTARTIVPEVSYHVTQRGNNRQDVFFVDNDRQAYLDILKQEAKTYGLAVHGFCLMTNHIHAIVVPQDIQSVANAMGRTHFKYTQYINRLHGRSGHLWQNRFYSCPLDDMHYIMAMKYIERNPVRAKMTLRAWRWPWSSAAAHAGKGKDVSGILQLDEWNKQFDQAAWARTLIEPDDELHVELLRLRTRTGRPLGSDKFISKLEAIAGRRLRPLTVGRPRKENK